MSKDWRIIVSGEWFYGTKEECERERAEFESTFTAEDFEEYEEVVPERICSGVPPDLVKLQATISQQEAEIARLKEVTNFKDAVACVFDNLKMVAANTRCKEWDDQLEELAEEVIEFAPEYKKQWKDIVTLQNDLASANSDKEAYGQNAIDLRKRLGKALVLLQETSMPQTRIDQILIN